MAKIRFSPRARHDLSEIWDYTAHRWGMTQAEAYIRSLGDAIEHLAVHPTLGMACDEVRAGYRKFHVASHSVYYCVVDVEVEIMRILHRRMDVDSHLD